MHEQLSKELKMRKISARKFIILRETLLSKNDFPQYAADCIADIESLLGEGKNIRSQSICLFKLLSFYLYEFLSAVYFIAEYKARRTQITKEMKLVRFFMANNTRIL